jgi:hypothetical protein
MAPLLQRLAQATFRHHRLVLLSWLIVIGLVVGLYLGMGSQLNNEFTIPGTESQTALDTLSRKLPATATASPSDQSSPSPSSWRMALPESCDFGRNPTTGLASMSSRRSVSE